MDKNIYKPMIEHLPLGVAYYQKIYDTNHLSCDYRVMDVNPAFEKMIGMELERLVGRKISDIFETISKEGLSWTDFYQSIKTNDQNSEYEIYLDFLDKYYRVKTHFLEKDYLLVYFNDVSVEINERKKHELLSDNIKVQIWYLKDPFTYGSVNKAHAEFLGLKKEELAFKNIDDIFSKEEADLCLQANKETFKEKKATHNEEWLMSASGERRLFKVSKEPKFDGKGAIEFVICSAEDITQKKRLEEEKKSRERILFSMVDFTHELVTNRDHYRALSNGLAMLGNATQVDRVYYWENHWRHGKQVTSQKFEWCLDGITRQIDNPDLQDISFKEVGDFIEVLVLNKPFISHIREMANTKTKAVLQSQGILSIIVLPIFVGDEFRGFIGFDSCRSEKEWTEVEISLLKSFVLLYRESLEVNRLEDDVLQTKENFDNFFNRINDFLFVLDLQGKIIHLNETALNGMGYSRRELLGQSVSILHPEEKRPQAQKNIAALIEGKIDSCNIPIKTKKGELILVETRVSQGIWNKKQALFAVAKDVSLLTMSEEKFSRAFNDSGISMFIANHKDNRFMEANDVFLDMVGFQRDEIMGKDIREFNIFENSQEGIDMIRQVERSGKLLNYEIDMRSKDNQKRVGLSNLVPLKINNESALLASIIDITDRKLMIEQLAEAKEASDAANKAKSQFLSNMSHEIRTPMNAVVGYSDLLAMTELTKKQENYVYGIKASSKMLMSIINDVLDWSKIENEGLTLEAIAFDLDEVINNVVEQVKFKSISCQVEFLVDKKNDIPRVLCGDPLRLQQVLLNLLSNAVKFTEVGQIKILIQVLKNEADQISLQFEVSDTGIGIPQEEIEGIFKPFKQVNNKLSGKFAGTGLGLAICKRIIRLIGGDISVKSHIDEGTTFCFTANFKAVSLKESLEIRKNDDLFIDEKIEFLKKLSGIKALVVDDNEINQDVIKDILEEMGVIVTLSSSGLEAIEKLKTKAFDIVLMDLRMPLMDGYETSIKIREKKNSGELPIIAVTANASPEEREKCRAVGMDDYVVKPIDRMTLFKAMIKHVAKPLEKKMQLDLMLRGPKGVQFAKEEKSLCLFDVAGIDVEKALNHLNGKHELLSKILKKFKKNHGSVVAEIRAALVEKDIELASRLAHTIKGISGEISAKLVNEVAADVEEQLIEGNLQVEKKLVVLEQALHLIFDSPFFKLKEPRESELKPTKEVDPITLNPLLTKLENLLLEYDMDASEQIDEIQKMTKGSSIDTKVLEMKEYGDQYDFDGALVILEAIKKRLAGEELKNGKKSI